MVTIRLPGAGTLVFNRYMLQRVIGRGGMGVVWLATDTKLDRPVALKFLPDVVGADQLALRELMDETRRGLDLAHPNIVRIYDLVNDDTAAAISMEYVDGKNLSERRLLSPHRVFTVEDVAPWLGHLCSAMDYAHLLKRIVHRDLKPANLMLDTEGALKITDFGIARGVTDAVSRLSRTNTQGASGTLPYMSPQQVMGERPQPTDDVYSIGASLYELLTSKAPFHSGDISLQITTKIAPPIVQRREELGVLATDGIPKEWDEAIAACLDKDPANRPQTAGELARRLGLSMSCTEAAEIARSKATVAMPAQGGAANSSATRARKKLPILAVVLACVAMLFMLALVGTGALWWWFHRAGEWYVKTDPPGAHVTVDGHTVVAPSTLPALTPGTHRAEIVLQGYEPREVEFDIVPGTRTDFGVVKLEHSTGSLLLTSEPDGVSYEVTNADQKGGEKFRGQTPDTVKLPVGKYAVVMKHSGEIKSTDVMVVRNETARQAFAFAKVASSPTVVASAASAINNATQPLAVGIATPSTSNSSVPLAAVPSLGDPPAALPPRPTIPPAATTPLTTGTESIPASDPVIAGNPPSATPRPPPSAEGFDDNPKSNTKPKTRGSIDGGTNIDALLDGESGNPASPSPSPAPSPASGDQDAPSAIPSPVAPPPQPVVQPPAAGFWTLEEILANSEYAGYSEPGRRYLVYKAQKALDEDADGVPGKGTYKAVQKFQVENSLQPTGQLDSQTLAALGLSAEPDKADWGKSRRSSEDRTPESEKTVARKFIERKILGGRDLKDIFRR
jgi:hypothetical protein